MCVNSYVPHNYYTLEPSNYISIVISTDFCIKNGLNPASVRFDACIEDARIGEIMKEIANEWKESDFAHSVTMHALILKLVAYVARAHSHKWGEAEGADRAKILGSTYESIIRAIDHISENFKESITLDELSALCGISKYHFLRIFKQVTSLTPSSYINRVRINYAKQLLLNGVSVTEAATASGFSDVHYFSNCFKKLQGCRPSEVFEDLSKSIT